MAFAIDSEVSGCHVYKDVWSARIVSELPCMLSKVFNYKDQYAITHTRFDTLKSSRDIINFCCVN